MFGATVGNFSGHLIDADMRTAAAHGHPVPTEVESRQWWLDQPTRIAARLAQIDEAGDIKFEEQPLVRNHSSWCPRHQSLEAFHHDQCIRCYDRGDNEDDE
jgi:hypothetical protein